MISRDSNDKGKNEKDVTDGLIRENALKKECAAYFKGQPAWQRLFAEMRKKWETYGKASGRITLSDGTEAEREVIVKVLGSKARKLSGEGISFSLKEFEEALQNTRFAPISLKELLDLYFGEEIQTTQEKRQFRVQKEEEFWSEIKDDLREKSEKRPEFQKIALWLTGMREEHRYGYSVLMEARKNHSLKESIILVQNVEEALANICSEEEFTGTPLAVLAASITGNPHYFDKNNLGGKLLVSALCSLAKREYPTTAYEWRELLLEYRILPDEVSNTVITYGLHLEMEDGLHPAFEGYCMMREPGILIMPALGKAKRAYGEGKSIFIVENEMVFSYLTKQFADSKITVLCTSGQPCTVAIRLIELLCKENVTIYYSGDMDPEGIRIADRLCERFEGRIKPWRMGAEDYWNGISNEVINERRLQILDMIKCPSLLETVSCMRENRKASYQENLLDEYVRDMQIMM